jgi:DNA polymerase III delta prime subunit
MRSGRDALLAADTLPLSTCATAAALPTWRNRAAGRRSAEGKQAVIALAGGDMRKAVTTLQSAQQLYGGSGTEITADALVEVSGRVSPHVRHTV